jgi:preprotein translocase subunit SecY
MEKVWTGWLISAWLYPQDSRYILLSMPCYFILRFFYTALVFNPKDTADNLKKSGAYIPGIRPGEQTSRYVDLL